VWSLHTIKKKFLDMHSLALPYGFDDRRRPFCLRRRQQLPTEKVELESAAAVKREKKKALAHLLP